MMNDFELFQSEFKKWQQRFGLIGYTIHFKHEPMDNSFADITTGQVCMSATVRLNSELPEKDILFKDIKRDAKHEALHLLIHELEARARCRYVSPDDIYESCEGLVNKLMKLIPEEE